MNSVKSQSKKSGKTICNGTFQKGENISGELTFGDLMPIVFLGKPSPELEPSQPIIPFKGVVQFTDKGEVTIILLTEVNPPVHDSIEVSLPTTIILNSLVLESYIFSC
jgi:hypothetical protein